MAPKISVILCTYNAPKLVGNVLDSIMRQTYEDYEVLCIDGKSRDETREIVKKYAEKDGRIRLLINKNRLPEGKGNGKWIGFREAKGEIVAIIDQDNVLQDSELFSKVLRIFDKRKGLLGVLGGLTHDLNDPYLVRYVSLFGTDSFFAYRSLDFARNFYEQEIVDVDPKNSLLTGGNCFFYDKEQVDLAGGYDQDVLVVKRLASRGLDKIQIIQGATKHYAEKSFFSLLWKQFVRKKAHYQNVNDDSLDYIPRSLEGRREFLKNFLFCLLVFPNFYYSIKIALNKKEKLALLFPFIAFANLFLYGVDFIRRKL